MSHLPLNSKEAQLIILLYEEKGEFLSSQLLGEHIGVSDRTVRKYMKNIRQLLTQYGALIETKKGQGYTLRIVNAATFQAIFNLLDKSQQSYLNVLAITEATDRERYILNKIFLEGQFLTVDEYAKELFVSKSTIMHALQNIRNQLQAFELSLINNVNEGVSIQGAEFEKRRFILNYFFKANQLDIYMNFNYDFLQLEDISLEALFIIVLEECRNSNMQLSDYVMQNLVMHLALAIRRIQAGKTIEDFQSQQDLDFVQEIEVAQRIVCRIEALADIKFPEDEAKYVALHLKSKSNQDHGEADLTEDHFNELQGQITQVLRKMQEDSFVEFTLDSMLLKGLEAHFEPLLTRLKMGIPLKNPLYEEVYGKYATEFEVTKRYFSQMPLLATYDIDNHEWAYITLHLLAAIERYKNNQQLKIIVICSTGMGSAQMLRNRLENEFGTAIQIMDVISYYQLDDQRLEGVDLIVSSINISTTIFTIPVVQVSVFLNDADIQQINRYIKDQSLRPSHSKQMTLEESHLRRLFNTFFSQDRYFIIDQAMSRQELLEEMVGSLSDCSDSDFIEEFIRQVELRERFGSLAFSETLAFPHPSMPLGVHSEIAVAIVREGLDWDEDHDKVNFVILMSPSKISNTGLSQVTDYFVNFVGNKASQACLLEDPSFENFKYQFINQQ